MLKYWHMSPRYVFYTNWIYSLSLSDFNKYSHNKYLETCPISNVR